jgi:hypothetical protein
LRVASREVVVDGHHVDAPAGQGVQDGGQRRDEGLALAGLHLGDLALVEDDAADELDVEVAHPERPLHGLAGSGEHVREDVVERAVDHRDVLLVVLLGHLAPTLRIEALELVGVGRRLLRELADLGPHLVDPSAKLGVVEGRELILELVGLVDEWLEALQLAIVRVDEPVQEAKHGTASIGPGPPTAGWGRRAPIGVRAAGRRGRGRAGGRPTGWSPATAPP